MRDERRDESREEFTNSLKIEIFHPNPSFLSRKKEGSLLGREKWMIE